ncbi:PD-(D/E)XK nuclease family protein [Flavobacterium silvaticum]|uniref:PD-(D/E)XK nuclease family protein n=1 Tax=Flavobacterium silvaticum TaxID=1852020 RepID=A0A972FKH6_9FLAO|nr:PD-(D/E)XK nuclease family protein [Flavobacterium silvaticum]NMH27646.1 PD-(D/E)XK nuclease family protein [Flavobacterium silvaticum]
MHSDSFLTQIAERVLKYDTQTLSGLTIILPNKRARVFLIESLRQQLDRRIFLPKIISIDEFITNLSGLRIMDRVELLFFFYEMYVDSTSESELQTFEQFSGWAKTLVQDFNEIDRYLLNPDSIFNYLEAITEIEHWSVEGPQRTHLIENYLVFWKKLPVYYHELYSRLKTLGLGYQGMVYRESVANLEIATEAMKPNDHFLFAGFNALNAAEERIIQHFLAIGCADVFWDIDKSILADAAHDASLFLRRYKNVWPYYSNRTFDWMSDDFSKPKNIRIIGTPKSIGQARVAGNIIEDLHKSGTIGQSEKVAIILGEENLLLPLLHALPNEATPLNITMGYPAKNTPPFILISKLFRLHLNAIARNQDQYVFYYKDVLEILNHPFIEPFVKANDCIDTIIDRNYTFIPHKKLVSMAASPDPVFSLLFDKWDKGPLAVLQRLSSLLTQLKEYLGKDTNAEQISLAMLYSCYKLINQLIVHYCKEGRTENLETLRNIFKETSEMAEISFEGEPLEGLQIMGVLESRLLDFDHIIITSMNEGNFPSGKGGNSFIPYDVKREKGLPTFKEKDAIYSYHFYHLLLRAKNIYLLYNTESEGIDAGEKSRFLTQIEIEKRPKHNLTHEIRFAPIPLIASEIMEIPKSESVMERLREIAEVGFSPSSLTGYIRNPIDFYYRKILRIRETEEVEESIALNTLGTIIHATLENLYKPFLNQLLTTAAIADCQKHVDAEILDQFRLVYKDGEIKKGKNLLAFEVAKRHVGNFLKMELADIENGDEIIIKELEFTCSRELTDPRLPYPIKIGGNVDRIELRNGKLRIVDYKTGKVEAKDMQLEDWTGLAQDTKREKILQVLAYAFMFRDPSQGREIEVGIVSFKNLKSGFMPFTLLRPDVKETVVTDEILQSYQSILVDLLLEILNPEIPFREKV